MIPGQANWCFEVTTGGGTGTGMDERDGGEGYLTGWVGCG